MVNILTSCPGYWQDVCESASPPPFEYLNNPEKFFPSDAI